MVKLKLFFVYFVLILYICSLLNFFYLIGMTKTTYIKIKDKKKIENVYTRITYKDKYQIQKNICFLRLTSKEVEDFYNSLEKNKYYKIKTSRFFNDPKQLLMATKIKN